jgi:hypothetical protein
MDWAAYGARCRAAGDELRAVATVGCEGRGSSFSLLGLVGGDHLLGGGQRLEWMEVEMGVFVCAECGAAKFTSAQKWLASGASSRPNLAF